MSKIYLEKAGFIRDERRDFSDDGTRFYCYTISGCDGLRITKATACGEYFLSCRIDGKLLYEEYSKLPHFNAATSKLNGIDQMNISQQDVITFYDDCVTFYDEYKNAEKNIQYPTVEEIEEYYAKKVNKRKEEFDEIKKLCTVEKILSFDTTLLRIFKDCYNGLKKESEEECLPSGWAQSHYQTSYSRIYINTAILDSYNYTTCKRYLTE